MSDEKSSNTFNVNMNTNGGQVVGVNTGKAEFTQHNGSAAVEPEVVLDRIVSLIPEDAPPADVEKVKASVTELRALVKIPAEEQKSPSAMEKVQNCLAVLAPYREPIAKGLFTGAVAGLRMLASVHPVMGVLLAGLDAAGAVFEKPAGLSANPIASVPTA